MHKGGSGQRAAGSGWPRSPGRLHRSPVPVSPRRRDLGNRQPSRRLQSGPLREYGSPKDAFPTGSELRVYFSFPRQALTLFPSHGRKPDTFTSAIFIQVGTY